MIIAEIKGTDIIFIVTYIIVTYSIIELIIYFIKRAINKKSTRNGCEIGCDNCKMLNCPKNPKNKTE